MPATIPIADDDAELLGLLALVVEQVGHSVLQAGDGAQALAIAERERPDLVLSDVQMPHVTGVELADHLRGRDDGYAHPSSW